MAKNNWNHLDKREAELNKKYAAKLQELDECLDEAKKNKLNLNILDVKESLDKVHTQIVWANTYLKKNGFQYQSKQYEFTATDIVNAIKNKRLQEAKYTLILDRMQSSWRQVKKGPVSSIEITPHSKDKLEKLARKNKQTMKDYATSLILSSAENEGYKGKFESLQKHVDSFNLSKNHSEFEKKRAHDKIKELITKYEELLKENIEVQVRFDDLSENSDLAKLTDSQHGKVNTKYDLRLSKCKEKFLSYEENKLSSRKNNRK